RMESQASGSSDDQRRAPRFHGRPSVSMRAGGFTLSVRGAHFFDGYQTSNGAAAFRNSVGLTPRWRLKAVLKPNASAYPTDRATWATVDSRSARSSSARSMRHSVRYRNGDSPMTSLKRLANSARETPASAASEATVHCREGLVWMASSAGPTTGSAKPRYQVGAAAPSPSDQVRSVQTRPQSTSRSMSACVPGRRLAVSTGSEE